MRAKLGDRRWDGRDRWPDASMGKLVDELVRKWLDEQGRR